ncbi:FAS1 domain-containing protein, partial [Melanomma pulvis-pyrius CBS 109.77]
ASTTAQSLKSILASHPALSIFQGFLEQFDLLHQFSSISNITILAPTNQAYLDLAQWGFNLSQVEPFIARALLTYHVLDGEWTSNSIPSSGMPQVVHTFLRPPILTNVSNGAAVKLYRKGNDITSESGLQVLGGVEEADIKFENGVLHTLNSSMVLPHNISLTAELSGLTEFLEILSTAHSVTMLESSKDITVFIPHNTVLKRLGPLLRMLEPRQLSNILGYHVIPGKVLYKEMLCSGDNEFTTLHGAILNTRVDRNGTIFVNDGKMIRSDLLIYGGVAHVIDDVLVP